MKPVDESAANPCTLNKTNNSFKSSDTNLYYKKHQMNIWVSDMMLSCLDLSLLIELKYIKNAVQTCSELNRPFFFVMACFNFSINSDSFWGVKLKMSV